MHTFRKLEEKYYTRGRTASRLIGQRNADVQKQKSSNSPSSGLCDGTQLNQSVRCSMACMCTALLLNSYLNVKKISVKTSA